MKTLLVASLLLCTVSPAFSQSQTSGGNSKNQIQEPMAKGPFGLEAGMNKKRIAALVGGEAKLKLIQDNVYSVETVPNPYPVFETYSLYIDPDAGLIKITACSKTIATSAEGIEIKDKFKELKAAIDENYGTGEAFDYLKVGSDLREPGDWMPGLLKKERVLAAYWLKKNITTLKNKINAINLETVALNNAKGILFLSYEFEDSRTASDKQKPKTNSPL